MKLLLSFSPCFSLSLFAKCSEFVSASEELLMEKNWLVLLSSFAHCLAIHFLTIVEVHYPAFHQDNSPVHSWADSLPLADFFVS